MTMRLLRRRGTWRSVLAPVLGCVLGAGLWTATASPASAIEGGTEVEGPSDGTDVAQIWAKEKGDALERYVCAGSVTSSRKILTAAHCFEDGVDQYFVRVGSKARGEGTRHAINRKDTRGDLAVLTVDVSQGTLDTRGAPYAQLTPNGPVKKRQVLESTGWGKTCERCGPSPYLKRADTKVNDNEDGVQDLYRGPAYQVRAIDARLWQGDSGGPSGYFPARSRVRVVTGVASRSVYLGPADAHMSATYDARGCKSAGGCVHDWLKSEAEMKVYEEGHTELRRRKPPLVGIPPLVRITPPLVRITPPLVGITPPSSSSSSRAMAPTVERETGAGASSDARE
jgi:hypothetical protein